MYANSYVSVCELHLQWFYLQMFQHMPFLQWIMFSVPSVFCSCQMSRENSGRRESKKNAFHTVAFCKYTRCACFDENERTWSSNGSFRFTHLHWKISQPPMLRHKWWTAGKPLTKPLAYSAGKPMKRIAAIWTGLVPNKNVQHFVPQTTRIQARGTKHEHQTCHRNLKTNEAAPC